MPGSLRQRAGRRNSVGSYELVISERLNVVQAICFRAGIPRLSLDGTGVRIVLGARILGISYDFLRRVRQDSGPRGQEPLRCTRPFLHFLPWFGRYGTATGLGMHRNSENLGLPSA